MESVNPLEQDTPPGQLAEYYRLLRQLTPAQRLRAMGAASRRMRMMAEAGIRLRQPDASEDLIRTELIRLLYGPEAVRRLEGRPGR